MTPSHPWAVLDDDGTPLFHVVGTNDPPRYARDAALEQLWRAKRNTMKPYYDHAGITIFHGDCRDVLRRT